MKTAIRIAGQISSVSKISMAINTVNAELVKDNFYSKIFVYKSKPEAVKALKEATKDIFIGNEVEFQNNILQYDAATAVIEKYTKIC